MIDWLISSHFSFIDDFEIGTMVRFLWNSSLDTVRYG
jgi:hypothetical protein